MIDLDELFCFWFVVGAVKDLSFLIDVLPSYIFPHDERIIGEWVLTGFSLGGHATWLGLRHGAVPTLSRIACNAKQLSEPRYDQSRGSALASPSAAVRTSSR